MVNPRTRYALTAALCASAAVLAFVGTASRYNPTFEGSRIEALSAELTGEIGAPVRAGLRVAGERLVLELRYTPRDETYVHDELCRSELRELLEMAAARFTGFADEVAATAEPSDSVLLVADVPPSRSMSETVAELRRRFDRKQILESGDRLWALGPGAAYRPWKYVVLHHSAGESGSAEAFDRWHREGRHWEGGLGYHFVIGNGSGSRDGEIEAGQRWVAQTAGAHARSAGNKYNEEGIGICLVGNFSSDAERAHEKNPVPRSVADRSEATRSQREALRFLTLYLCLKLNLSPDGVMGHRDVPGAKTVCPGGSFPMDAFRRELRRDLDRLKRAG